MREQSAVTRGPERRLEAASADVIGQYKLRHGFKHRQFDRLPLPGPIASNEGRHDRVDRTEADDAIGNGEGNVARLTGAGEQRGDARRTLDEIVIGGPSGIRPALAIPREAHINEPRVAPAQDLLAEIEPMDRGGPHIVNEDVGGFAQPHQDRASGRLFEIEHEAALVAIDGKEERAHPGTAHRARHAHDVAARRLHFNDVGAVIAEDLRRVGPHQDGRHVDDAHAVKRARGARGGSRHVISVPTHAPRWRDDARI